MKLPIIIVILLLLTRVSFCQPRFSIDMTSAHIRTDKLFYATNDTISMIANGELYTTGDCKSSVMWGLVHENGAVPDTIIDIRHMNQMDCGLPVRNFINEKTTLFIVRPEESGQVFSSIAGKGTFRLTFIDGKSGLIINSNNFDIRH